MSKKKKNLGSRRKRMNRKNRLQHVKDTKWIEKYDGKNIEKGYSKWFSVDRLCAVNELEMLGCPITEKAKQQAREAIESKKLQELRKKQKRNQQKLEEEMLLGDETFYFIAGYTSNGIPFGITYEEMEEMENNENNNELDKYEDPF